jgi:hypothetical protein
MQLTRYNTDLGSDTLPTFLPSAAELAIMAIPTRAGRGPSRCASGSIVPAASNTCQQVHRCPPSPL